MALLWGAVTNGVRKRAGTSCDSDRLREGASLVTYCSPKKQGKLCTYTLQQAQRLATCRSGVISDSARWHGTLSEECVVATEAGSTQHVGALPSQQNV